MRFKALLLSLLMSSVAVAQTAQMGINKPVVNGTLDPEWANLLNNAIDVIDAHDHSAGRGVKINPSGLNINADLTCNSNDVTDLRSVRFENQSAALSAASDLNAAYAKDGNLYYRNGSGANVQITSGGSVVSSISGAFSAFTPGAYPYSVTAADAQRVLQVDTSATRTINLPAATTAMLFMIKDITGSAATNNITVVRSGSNTIDGTGANKTLNENFGWWVFISNGSANWSFGKLGAESIGANQVFTPTSYQFRADTSDGSDTKSFTLCAGGACTNGRGARVNGNGFDAGSNPGQLRLVGDGGKIVAETTNNQDIELIPDGTGHLNIITAETSPSASGLQGYVGIKINGTLYKIPYYNL